MKESNKTEVIKRIREFKKKDRYAVIILDLENFDGYVGLNNVDTPTATKALNFLMDKKLLSDSAAENQGHMFG